jgi:putative CocE/NonD family hydrolase
VDFGPEAANEFDREQLRWFDRWLKEEENGYLEEPNVGMFVMGANTWRHADRWPPSDVEYTRFYLHGREPANAASGAGRLNRTAPGEEPPDVYPYDPRNPVQSIGGRSCCDPNVAPVGPADQRPNYARNDILLYTSEPLSEPVEVTGPVSATLHVSSSAPDTDFVVKLIDVHPDGRAINVAEGILRARYRNARSDPEPLVQGEIHEIEVDLAATSNVFKQGHRIQVYVTSSDFPQYDRNPNTGGDIASCNHADFETATQTLYHDRDRPSHVTLPLLPSPVSE